MSSPRPEAKQGLLTHGTRRSHSEKNDSSRIKGAHQGKGHCSPIQENNSARQRAVRQEQGVLTKTNDSSARRRTRAARQQQGLLTKTEDSSQRAGTALRGQLGSLTDNKAVDKGKESSGLCRHLTHLPRRRQRCSRAGLCSPSLPRCFLQHTRTAPFGLNTLLHCPSTSRNRAG